MKIYHNPRCAKSRQTLSIIREAGQDPEIVEYLKTPLTEEELTDVYEKLNLPIDYLIRKGEDIFKTEYKDKQLSDEEWIKVLVTHPSMLERPIVVNDEKAVLGRPPENVNQLL